MRKSLRFFISLLLPALISGCSNEVAEGLPMDDSPVPQIATRGLQETHSAHFVGIKSDGSYAFAYEASRTDGNSPWTWSDGLASHPMSEAATLAASAPAWFEAIGSTTATLTQGDLQAHYSNGLMVGVAACSPSGVSQIVVRQQLSLLEITFDEALDFVSEGLEVSPRVITSATLDWQSGTLTMGGKALHPVTLAADRKVRLPIFPQSFAKGDLIFQFTHNGNTHSYTMPSDYTVKVNHSIAIHVGSSSLTVGVQDWKEHPNGDITVN